MPKSYGTPGTRAISPDCCTSQSLAACSLGAQLLFDRLMVQADDQGRLQADPMVVKAACFPLAPDATPRRIATWMGELVAQKMVEHYKSGTVFVAQLLGWWKFQSGMRRAYPSRWDAPKGWIDKVYGQVGTPTPDGPSTVTPQDDGKVPAERGQNAGKVPAERPQSAPDFPPRARGAVSGTTAVSNAGADDARGAVFDVVQLVETLTERPFGYTAGSKVWELLAEDVGQLGVERVSAAYREVKAAVNGAPLDAAGMVYGGHKHLFPFPDGPERMTPAERKRAERDEVLANIRRKHGD